jgi:hypothetical protein
MLKVYASLWRPASRESGGEQAVAAVVQVPGFTKLGGHEEKDGDGDPGDGDGSGNNGQ